MNLRNTTFLLAFLVFSAFAAEVPRLSVPHAEEAPIIDGNLSDAVWAGAAHIDGLKPAIDAAADLPAPPQTTVRVLWSETHLYVAYDCVDDEVYSSGTLNHDDNLFSEDVVEVFLDGKGDGQQFVEIQCSPDGTNLDLMYVYSSETKPGEDGRIDSAIIRTDRWGFREWEMWGLRTAARKTDKGWSAEFAIPVGSIVQRLGRKTLEKGLELHAHFVRYDYVPAADGTTDERRLLQQTWNPVLTGNPHNSPFHMGVLVLE